MNGGNILESSITVSHPSRRSVGVSVSFIHDPCPSAARSRHRISKSRMGIPNRVLRIWKNQNIKVLDRAIRKRNPRLQRLPPELSRDESAIQGPQNSASSVHALNGRNIHLSGAETTEISETQNEQNRDSGRIERNLLQKVIALDCEMVGTGPKGRVSALARCSIVDYHGNVLYDKYVRPCEPITDYRTKWSGITRSHIAGAIPFWRAQDQIADILNGNIIIGHAIFNDFQVLKIHHPVEHTRDTAKCKFLKDLANLKENEGVGLKKLARILLNKRIQSGSHCSVEDAQACMSLYRLVEHQWEDEMASLYPDLAFRISFMDDHFWSDVPLS